MLSVRCFDAVPYEKIEALCSFLQAENVGNFQSLQRMFGDGSCATECSKKMKTDIAASRIIAWNCFIETILFVWEILRAFSLKMWIYSSTLLVYIYVMTFVGDWWRYE